MDPSAFIQFVQVKMGVIPGWGGGTRLVKLLGKQRALHLLGTARRCDASDAQDIGLVDQIVQGDEMVDFVQSFHQGTAPGQFECSDSKGR